MLVLVRLLPAEVYGQFGFLTALLAFLTLYSFREFLAYTLVVREADQVHYQDHFTAGAVLQAAVCLVANVIAVALRQVPEYATVAPVLHVMSVHFLLDLPSEFRVRMLERQLDWRRLRLLHGIALVAAAGLSVALALAGTGVYALILPTLTVHLVFTWDLFVRERFRPTWSWQWPRFRPAWHFGVTRIAGGSASSAGTLIEASWISAVGFAALGVFGRAVGLGQLLCGRIAGLLAQAIFPVLARIPPRSDSYRQASALFLRGVVWLVVPLAIAGAWLAEIIVAVLYGPAWLAVAPLLPWALLGASVLAAVQAGYVLLLAHNGQRQCLVADVWRLVGTVAALGVLAGVGLREYLAGLAVVHAVSLGLILFWLERARAVSRQGLVDAGWPALVAAGAGVTVAEVATRWLPGGAGTPDTLVPAVALFGVTYGIVLRVLFRRQVHELVRQLPEPARLSRLLRLEGVT